MDSNQNTQSTNIEMVPKSSEDDIYSNSNTAPNPANYIPQQYNNNPDFQSQNYVPQQYNDPNYQPQKYAPQQYNNNPDFQSQNYVPQQYNDPNYQPQNYAPQQYNNNPDFQSQNTPYNSNQSQPDPTNPNQQNTTSSSCPKFGKTALLVMFFIQIIFLLIEIIVLNS